MALNDPPDLRLKRLVEVMPDVISEFDLEVLLPRVLEVACEADWCAVRPPRRVWRRDP